MRHLTSVARAMMLALLAALRLSAQVHEHVAAEKLGTVHFQTSCAPAVAPQFDRAIALLHSFQFGAAIRGFNDVVVADSTCAMARWGIALSRWQNPMSASNRSATSLEQGRQASTAAIVLAEKATPRERAYIEAVGKLYADYEKTSQRDRVLAYEAAMSELATRFIADNEATIFYALSMIAAALPTDKTYAKQLNAGSMLEAMWAKQPDHPGLAHYIIHAYDVPALAPQAKAAAQRYADIAPSAAHALHMPSHTFTRLGLWEESVATNLKSMEAGRRDSATGEILHASDYAVYAYLQMRNDSAAKAILDALPALAANYDLNAVTGAANGAAGVFALAAIPARYALERREWKEAAAIVPRSSPFPHTEAMSWFTRALGSAHIGDRGRARTALDSLRQIGDRLKAAGDAYWVEQVSIQVLEARAALYVAEGQPRDALPTMREAVAREDATEKSAVTPGPLVPARELLADMLLEARRPKDAIEEYRRVLIKEPNRFRSLYGAMKSATAFGDRKAEAEYKAKIEKITRSTAFTPSAIAAPAGGQGRALTIEDYYRVKTVGAPQISANGRWVAFTVSRRIEATNGDSTEIWLTPTDAATARRISRAGTHATAPQWSADGQLSFAVAGRRWMVNPAAPDSIVESPTVTPQSDRGGQTMMTRDGRWQASLRPVAVPARDPWAASDFEKRHEERFKGRQFDWLNFQRDGAAFPVANRVDPLVNPTQEIWVGSEGGAPAQITRLGLRPAGVQWSPDGSTVLFTADSGYRNERLYEKSDIYVADREGQVRRITDDREHNYTGARYSPDGRWILYTKQLSTNTVIAKKLNHGGATDLAVMPAGGGAEKVLTADWDYLPSGARWSPDSKSIYFTGGIGGTTHLFRVAPSGEPVVQVTKGERRLSGVEFDSAFTKITYTVGTYEAPSEIYVANVDGSNERQLTRVHDAFVAEVGLSKSERLQFRSKDGTPIEGWLLYPHNYRRDAGPYPLVVASHGGPHSADGYGFDFKDQYFAANGYFVLQVNFRSSTGYGEKFLWGTWGAWGDRDGEDVMAGLEYALSRNPIDRDRVATIGHSYGGFMTNWLITQYPDRFAAAIPGAGIVNWVSDYGTADIARTKETEFFGTPWDSTARAIMIRQSPLTYAGRVRTPTLFINGEIDERVPYSEAEQMFVALKKNGVPAKIIQYQGMPHSISGSWNNVHRMLNELRWLDTYLKPTKS